MNIRYSQVTLRQQQAQSVVASNTMRFKRKIFGFYHKSMIYHITYVVCNFRFDFAGLIESTFIQHSKPNQKGKGSIIYMIADCVLGSF